MLRTLLVRSALDAFAASASNAAARVSAPNSSTAVAAAGVRLMATDQPKHARNAYNFFVSDHFKAAKDSGSSMKSKEIMAQAAAAFKALSPSEKAKYEAMAEEDKKLHPPKPKVKGKSSPWGTFVTENYADVAKALGQGQGKGPEANKAVIKELAARWGQLTPEEKAEYKD